MTDLLCYNNNISILDVTNLTLLNTLWCFNNNLDTTQLENILLDLDNNGLSSGVLDYSINPGESGLLTTTQAVVDAHASLISKGWSITGIVPVSVTGFTYTFPITFTPVSVTGFTYTFPITFTP